MIEDFIQYITRFVELNDEEKSLISSSIRVKTYKKGTVLLREGQVARTSYFNLGGIVRMYYLVEGEEKTTFFYTENQFITSMRSFTDKKPSTHFFECMEDCTLALIPNETEQSLLKNYPKLESFARVVLEEELGNYQEMLSGYIISSPDQRYQNLLDNHPQLIQRIPQFMLASYLGIKPESLSRIKKRLAEKRFLT